MDSYQEIFDNPLFSADKAAFYPKIYTTAAKKIKKIFLKGGDNFKRVCMEEYDDLSKRVERSKFQEGTSVRNMLRARRLANLLITEEGKVNLSQVPKVIKCLKEHLFHLGPDRQDDALRQEHILKALQILEGNKTVVQLIHSIGRPYAHKVADQIIRDTLQLPANVAITDAHARRACLAAWFTYLRQNVGSCFATAPAIIVHSEQPEQFFKDISELLNTGRLKRTFAGVEHTVPISASWGAGDLRRAIALYPEHQDEIADIALSPGLLNALESAKIISSETPLSERIHSCQQLIMSTISDFAKPGYAFYVSAEDILRLILMKHLSITEKDLDEFEKRPKAMFQGTIMMQMPAGGAIGGKGEACLNFYSLFEIAKNSFKALTENALLKTWEFTLASFAETKPNFTTWNLYSSLGLQPNEKGGIGNALYEILSRKLEMSNAKVREYQSEYEMLYSQLKFLEARMQNASSEKEARWIKIEYETKRSEFRTFEEIRNREHFKAQRFANLLNDLVDAYMELFPKYFQEVYDADMHEVTTGFYDDSPAGFRLLYKHGRANTAQWTLIHSPQEYIDALSSFFTATEIELTSMPVFEGLQDELSEIITKIITHIKTDDFLIGAFYRMGEAHNMSLVKNPLEDWRQIEKKPWSYTSGGSLDNLVSSYFRLEGKPAQVGRWVENEMELLVFFIDTFKHLPAKILDEYIKDPKKSLLTHSPTHAYNLKPGFVKEAIMNDAFTYTWARDNLLRPMERFVEYMFLTEEMQEFLLEKLNSYVPMNFRPRFKNVFSIMQGKKNPREFRSWIVDTMESDRGLTIGRESVLPPEIIDSSLFSYLPLFSSLELKTRLEKILHALPGIKDEATLDAIIDRVVESIKSEKILTAKQLQDIAKAILIIFFDATSTSVDYHLHIARAAQNFGYAMPTPFLFADTNWAKDFFGFVVNPGTGQLDLWRLDYTGSRGFPMSSWREWLNGSRRDLTWGVYNKPFEYLSN